ncbi:3'-5' exonuclease eri1-related [Anaeramoeba flamelloides]|uniref:3'-5' exonuclease eri1-related n=1 Tax=Anaeramoeba flamelloides TaxID=1746091 RepID=A0ABQ8XNH0_9EUKA|nr:3'-5' exonuclease eri1-related [Anaeramoeba flamelloides]
MSNTKNSPNIKKTTEEPLEYVLVLDFEATCGYLKHQTSEIIEFPVVVLNLKTLKIESEFHYYVKPVLNPRLSKRCTKLTGINQGMVNQGKTFCEVLLMFEKWLLKLGLINKQGEKTKLWEILTCSDTDLQAFLEQQLKLYRSERPPYLKTWVDIQPICAQFVSMETKTPSLSNMLEFLNLEIEGRLHSGIDDSRNTARIVVELQTRGLVLTTKNIKTFSDPFLKVSSKNESQLFLRCHFIANKIQEYSISNMELQNKIQAFHNIEQFFQQNFPNSNQKKSTNMSLGNSNNNNNNNDNNNNNNNNDKDKDNNSNNKNKKIVQDYKLHVIGSCGYNAVLRNSNLDIAIEMKSKSSNLGINGLRNLISRHDPDVELKINASNGFKWIEFKEQQTMSTICLMKYINGSSVLTTKIMRKFCDLDFRVRPLLILMRKWARSQKLLEKINLPIFSLDFLVIYYLQQIGIIPQLNVDAKTFQITTGKMIKNKLSENGLHHDIIHLLAGILRYFGRFYNFRNKIKLIKIINSDQKENKNTFKINQASLIDSQIKNHRWFDNWLYIKDFEGKYVANTINFFQVHDLFKLFEDGYKKWKKSGKIPI